MIVLFMVEMFYYLSYWEIEPNIFLDDIIVYRINIRSVEN